MQHTWLKRMDGALHALILVFLLPQLLHQASGACNVNTTIISVRENVPAGTVIMRLPRESGEQWSFHEDGPQGYIELKAHQHSVVFYFAKVPDLEELSSKTSSTLESIPFTLECSYDGWKHVFKQSIVLMDVNDNDPVFLDDKATVIAVNENTSPGTAVLQLDDYATDPDVTGYITAYDVVPHSDMENDGYGHFTISGSGKELVIKEQLDFDQLRLQGRFFYLLNLTAMDNGYPEQRQSFMTLQVNISDNDDLGPAFVYPDCPLLAGYCTTPLYETVAKKSFTGELKVWPGTVRAVDRDSMNNSIVYSIVKVTPKEYGDHFNMEAETGQIQVVKAFGKNIDVIHVTIKAEEESMTRRFLTTTLRVQVVMDNYISYKDRFRNIPINEAVEEANTSSTSSLPINSVPVSLFISAVVIFFVLVVSVPVVMLRIVRAKLASAHGSMMSLQLSSVTSGESGRKKSTDTTASNTSVFTCISNESSNTLYSPSSDRESDTISTSSSASSASRGEQPTVRLNVDNAGGPDRRVSSVSFDSEEITTSFSPPMPIRYDVSSAERFKRRLCNLFNFDNRKKDRQKNRVRFDIRNLSDFS